MRASEISWWPDQVAHLTETFAAFALGYAVTGTPSGGAVTGFVQVAQKEGEDLYYKWKSGKWAAGDVIDLVIHLFGVAIPFAILQWIGA